MHKYYVIHVFTRIERLNELYHRNFKHSQDTQAYILACFWSCL